MPRFRCRSFFVYRNSQSFNALGVSLLSPPTIKRQLRKLYTIQAEAPYCKTLITRHLTKYSYPGQTRNKNTL